jgi:hypothetical protein
VVEDSLFVDSAGASHSSFDISRGYEFDPTTTNFHFTHSLSSAAPFLHTLPDSLVDQGFGLLNPSPSSDHLSFTDPSLISSFHVPPGQTNVHEALVMHYFDNVQRVQPFFAGEILTDITYSVSPYRVVEVELTHFLRRRWSLSLAEPSHWRSVHWPTFI